MATELNSGSYKTVFLASNGKLIWKRGKHCRQLLGHITQYPEDAGSRGGVKSEHAPQREAM